MIKYNLKRYTKGIARLKIQINIKNIQNEVKNNISSQTLAIYAGFPGFSEWVAQPNKKLSKKECELHFTYAVFSIKSFIEGKENFYRKQEFKEQRSSMEKVHKKAIEIILNPTNSILFLCGYLFDSNSNLSKKMEIPKEIISLILSPNLKLLNFDEFKKANSNCKFNLSKKI